MFVGDGCCFSVSAKDFVGLKKNCVYFSNDRFVGGKGHFPDWKAGQLDLENDNAQPLKSLSDILKFSGLRQPSSGKHRIGSKNIIF